VEVGIKPVAQVDEVGWGCRAICVEQVSFVLAAQECGKQILGDCCDHGSAVRASG
jgi:hypothetical protein